MKKYTLFSFVFVLSLFLLGSGAKSVSAYDSGCNGSGPYSVTTGQLCSTTPTTPAECAPGDLFSYLTGQACPATTSQSGSGFVGSGSVPVSTSGPSLSIGSRGDAVKTFQQALVNAGLLSGKIDGVYGKMTAAAATQYYKIHPCPVVASGSNATSFCGPLPTPVPPITVTPPTIVSGTATYNNSTYGVSFNYPSTETLLNSPISYGDGYMGPLVYSPASTNFISKSGVVVLAGVGIPASEHTGTTFSNGIFAVSVNPSITSSSSCAQFADYGTSNTASQITKNGITYSEVVEGLGAAGGHSGEFEEVHTYQNNHCYEFVVGQDDATGAMGNGDHAIWDAAWTLDSYLSTVMFSGTTSPTQPCSNMVGATCPPTTSTVPVINSLSTTSGPVGTSITINGSGFGSSNTVSLNGTTVARGVSSSGSMLTFVLQNYIYGPCATGTTCMGNPMIYAGSYQLSVTSNGQVSNSLPFTITSVTTPTASNSISVFSPNGGEAWTSGTTHSITWQDGISGVQTDDVSLVSPISNVVQTIARNISGGAYSWTVGQVSNPVSNVISTALSGSYKIQVCKTGTTICDSSDQSFTIN